MRYFLKYVSYTLFKKHLLVTNTVTSGILMSIGDGLSQHIERKWAAKERKSDINMKFDWPRNIKMFIVGAGFGPSHHYFYIWLDKVFPIVTFQSTITKVLYDQLVLSPIIIAQFFFTAGWLYGKANAESWQELKSKFITVYKIDWCVWPGAQFLNFYYVQPKYRVLYVNFVTVLYDIFLAYVKHDEHLSS